VVLPPLDGHGPADGSFKPERLRQALALFKKLPASDRQPRPEGLPAAWRKGGYPTPPKGGLVLKLHGRAFGLDGSGKVHPFPHSASPMLDFLWMTQEEVKALAPDSPRKGDSFPMPGWFARRLRGYRLLTESLSGSLPTRVLSRHPDREPTLALTVEEVTPGEVRLRLHGSLPIRYAGWDVSNRRVEAGDYDCEHELLGQLTYDRGKGSFTRFDVVSLGAVKQLGSFKYPKPEGGRLTIGVTFELGDGTAVESIPPYGLKHGNARDYYAHDDPAGEATTTLRYVRAGKDRPVLESLVSEKTTKEGRTYTSVTDRVSEKMTLTLRFDTKGRLTHAEAVQETAKGKQAATVVFGEKEAVLKRGRAEERLKVTPAVVVTTAPDWSDIFQVVRRYDRKKGGKQTFAGLWIHPVQDTRHLDFTVEPIQEDAVVIDGKKVMLQRYRVQLRSGAYLVWADASGRVVRLTPPGKPGAHVTLEGHEKAMAELK
jgi:hypothetical protein